MSVEIVKIYRIFWITRQYMQHFLKNLLCCPVIYINIYIYTVLYVVEEINNSSLDLFQKRN